MSPMSYLRLHRMQLAHRLLGQRHLEAMRISDVAGRHGVRGPGRSAGAYRKLFEEPSSWTLRRVRSGPGWDSVRDAPRRPWHAGCCLIEINTVTNWIVAYCWTVPPKEHTLPLAQVPNPSDPEQLGAAYAVARAELIPTGRSQFHARVNSRRMDRVWMLRVFEPAPRRERSAQSPQRAFIGFRIIPRTGLINDGGRTIINTGAPPVNKSGKEDLTARPDEPEWLSTLPAGVPLVYDYWRHSLKPGDCGFSARTSNYPAKCPAMSASSSPGQRVPGQHEAGLLRDRWRSS